MTHAYRLATLKLISDFTFPELMPWDGPAETPAEVVVRQAEVARRLTAADHVTPVFETKGRSEYLLSLSGIGRILVCNGNAITVDGDRDADPIATRAVLTGPIQAVLWHQRGQLPLHASAVLVNRRVAALAGPSASGKSALAAALSADGGQVVADDVCVIDTADGAATVLPAGARLRLWRDALDRLGIAARHLTPTSSSRQRYLVDVGAGSRNPWPLAAVIQLQREPNLPFNVERLRGASAAGVLHRVVHTRRAARALGRECEIFQAITRLISGGVTVWRLRVPEHPECIVEAAARVRALLEG